MKQSSIKKVLLIEDHAGDALLLRTMFEDQNPCNIELTHVDGMSAAEAHLVGHAVDFILLDLGLPDAQGLEAIKRARAAAPGIPLVVLTGLDDEAVAETALQAGAQDYLIKGQIDGRGLLRALRYAAERTRLEQLKNEFISTVSHELRTPLTSIYGSLGLLIANTAGALSVPASRLLTIAYSNSQRLVRLVNDILDIEKMNSGQVNFNFEKVDLRSLILQTIEANQGYADSYKVRIRLEEPPAVHEVCTDPGRLAQVVTNLLSNAIKFSSPDSEVIISVEHQGEFERISVRDYGPGITDSFKKHVFERFAQADATNAGQKGGTGLGLSIVKQIVDRLGGAVGFDDAQGGGTIFSVDLPCWERRKSAEVDLPAQLDAPRVMLCEDDQDFAIVLSEQIRQHGLVTDIASTSKEAFVLTENTRYRAVFVDLQLPSGDGINLILRLRASPQYRETPIIIVSSTLTNSREDAGAFDVNILGWLTPPLDFDHVMRALGNSGLLSSGMCPQIAPVRDGGAVTLAPTHTADVGSAGSIEEARRTLKTTQFDIASRRKKLAGSDPLVMPELRDNKSMQSR